MTTKTELKFTDLELDLIYDALTEYGYSIDCDERDQENGLEEDTTENLFRSIMDKLNQ